MQEGLGVFAEWAVGGLNATRVRLLAARVVAVDAMLRGADFGQCYRLLADDHGFTPRTAFNIAARVYRSGGLAKDLIYLKGFKAVVDLVAAGASLDPYWLGKIAPAHAPLIEELLQRGLLHAPRFVPNSWRARTRKAESRVCEAGPVSARSWPGSKALRLAFFVNDIEREFAGYTTTVLAHQAAMRGHEVCYITPSDFVLTPDDCLRVHGRFLPKTKWKDREEIVRGAAEGQAPRPARSTWPRSTC